MIKNINDQLADMGSSFRTEDGLTLIAYIGGLTFLRRTFSTIEETASFVQSAYDNVNAE